jgi:hypothetical protein
MANTFAPFGFSQIGIADGTDASFATIAKAVAQGNSNVIYRGDPVKQLATGYIDKWTAGTAVSQLAGIFWSCSYTTSTGPGYNRSLYWPGSGANADVFAQIIPIMFGAVPVQFLVQTGNSAGGATAFGAADIGKNIDVALGTGSTTTGLSGAYADQNTEANTATLPFRITGLWTGGILNPSVFAPYGGTLIGTDTTSANNCIIVVANNFQATGI